MYYLFMKPYMTTRLININLSAYVQFSSDSDKYSLRRKDECTLMKNYARTNLFQLRYFNRIVDMWTSVPLWVRQATSIANCKKVAREYLVVSEK